MLEASIAIAICLFMMTFMILGLFVGTTKRGRTGWKIATSFAIAAVILVIAIIIHGPVPEDHELAERESVTQSDN